MSDHFDRVLRESLQHRADDTPHVDLAANALRQAGRITRRRRLAASVGVIAAVALVVPIGAHLADQETDRTASKPVDDTSPTRPVDIAISGLSQGAAPVVPYIDGRTLHDGERTVPLPATDGAVTDAIALPGGAGLWILDPETGKTRFESTDPALGVAPQSDVTNPVLNSARHEAAWVAHTTSELDDFVTIDTSAGTATIGRLLDPQAQVQQVMGVSGGTLVANTSFMYSGLEGSGRFVAKFDTAGGDVTMRPTNTKYATAVSADLTRLAGRSADMEGAETGCTAMYESSPYTQLWESCEWRPVEFSGDGTMVLAVDAASDGLGPRGMAVLDSDTGDVERVFTTEGTFGRATFEESTTVVTIVNQGDQGAIVRCTIDTGECELATSPATVIPDDPDSLVYPYQLTAN